MKRACLVLAVAVPFALSCEDTRQGIESKREETVWSPEPNTVAVAPDSAFARKLQVVPIAVELVEIPVLTVTGSIVAQLRAGSEDRQQRWQFASADALATWADWRRAQAERTFAERQLEATRALADQRVRAQSTAVERLRKLVEVGTDSQKDLAFAEADLAANRLEGEKEVFAAQAARDTAARTVATLERELAQTGIDPKLLNEAPEGAVIVAAEVPEAQVGLVKIGQACTARFYGAPEAEFSGRVRSLASSLLADRRTLPALFELVDRDGRLRPAMFADVHLGTEPREALLVPAEGVIHIDRADYALVENEPGRFRVVEVKVGEAHDGKLQVIAGLESGDRVISSGAILLKPYIARALSN